MADEKLDLERQEIDRAGTAPTFTPVAEAQIDATWDDLADEAAFKAAAAAVADASKLGYQVRNKLNKMMLVVKNNSGGEGYVQVLNPSQVDGLEVAERTYTVADGDILFIGPWPSTYHAENTEDSGAATPTHKDYVQMIFGTTLNLSTTYDDTNAAARFEVAALEI